MNNRINIRENKAYESDGGPRFIVKFHGKASEGQKRKNSYDVLSRLIVNRDVIVEVNGTLLNLPSKERDSYISKFIENIKSIGLEYRCSKVAGTVTNSLLNLFGNKTTQEHIVTAYIPNEIWSKPQMQELIPFYGARYFVLNEGSSPTEALDELDNLEENDYVNHFDIIVYDAMCLNSMGIFTNNYDIEHIKAILEIS